jgi:glucose-1-phosphate cytidylyltransferase
MKVLILAGGFGTRLAEETSVKPKPMVEVAGKPIIWHIMKLYSRFGFNDFVVLLGYKGYVIKEYFANYFLHQSDVTIDLEADSLTVHKTLAEPWRVSLIDTGNGTLTGGRIKRAQEFVDGQQFLLTYGDGLSDVPISSVIDFHNQHNGLLTLTGVQPEGRFGALNILETGKVNSFVEKPRGDGAWVNGGFFVCDPGVFDYIDGDDTVFEQEPMRRLAEEGLLFTYRHEGFWQPMDTLRDKKLLEEHASRGDFPWLGYG